MKKLLLITAILSTAIIASARNSSGATEKDSLTLFCTPALYNLASSWSHEYNATNPVGLVRIVSADAGKARVMLEKGQAGFATGSSELLSGQSWRMIVGRDVVVPVINSKNPAIGDIMKKGVSPANLSRLVSGQGENTWGMLLGNEDKARPELYCIDDAGLRKSISDFIGTDAGTMTASSNAEEMLIAVRNNISAIGFCRLADISEPALMENISLLPLDRNNDGMIDHNEDIYNDLNAFARGVWIGKYPSALVTGIYTISAGQPTDESAVAFLKWILDRGQVYLGVEGYTALLSGERISGAEKLIAASIPVVAVPGTASIFRTLLMVLIMLSAAAALVIIIGRLLRRKPSLPGVKPVSHKVLDEKSIILPGGILFDKTHTWAFMEQDGLVRIGVDDFMHHVTGSIGKIRMKKEGESVKKGEEILSIVSKGKQLNLYAPVSGTIRKRNSVLESDAAAVNTSPYNNGWVYMIEPLNWSRESPLLMMADKHRQFLKEELTKLRDFLAEVFAPGNPEMAAVILQDGGALIDSPLEDMSPEVWDNFQTKFIDPSRQVWFYELY